MTNGVGIRRPRYDFLKVIRVLLVIAAASAC
jgi:hypothetical protein